MKKRVEAELISIAHRILKLKNKSEVDQLYKETQKLYEALTILKFYGDNYEMVKQTVAEEDLEEKLTAFIELKQEMAAVITLEKQPEIFEQPIPVKEEVEEEIAKLTENEATEKATVVVGEVVVDEDEDEDAVEDESFEENDAEEEVEIEDLVGETADEDTFMPSFELSFEEEKKSEEDKIEEKVTPTKKFTMDEVLGGHFKEAEFVKPEENRKETAAKVVEETAKTEVDKSRVLSLNDALSNTISIGLNDRIGFVKHLFNESNEDYNRVLSQLNTFNTFDEAKEFLNEMVIPDYNYWVGKEEYLERFMEAIEKKFK